MKPHMTNDVAYTSTCHVCPQCRLRADGEEVRPSDEFSIHDVDPHSRTNNRQVGCLGIVGYKHSGKSQRFNSLLTNSGA